MIKDKSFDGTTPLLYIIATPIGNLKEMSPRALEIIKEMDYIACEDTRVSGKLLSFFDIKKPLISCHEHNENEASEKIISLLKEGKHIAFMSDAGYPSISDPGQKLIENALKKSIKISVISGSSAFINALVGSGMNSKQFIFYGFLPAKASARKEELRKLYNRVETIIFYESPHRIITTINDLYLILGNRKACIARELTKIHEEYIRGSLEEFIHLTEQDLPGEMVIIVEGNNEEVSLNLNNDEIKKIVSNFASMGLSTKDAIKKASELLKINKNEIYRIYHN
jgi:16S rRNA (cytidine1402-2'-O)-methyltransferase